MKRFGIAALAGISLLAATSSGAEPPKAGPDRKSTTSPKPRLDPPKLTCNVDLAIGQITLSKGKSAGSVVVAVETRNVGSSVWQSGSKQQALNVVVKNGNTGNVSDHSWDLPGSGAAGSRLATNTTPLIPEAFDTFEFSGTVEARIAYDSDILLDSNACNDDRNSSNNLMVVTSKQVAEFLGSTATTRAY